VVPSPPLPSSLFVLSLHFSPSGWAKVVLPEIEGSTEANSFHIQDGDPRVGTTHPDNSNAGGLNYRDLSGNQSKPGATVVYQPRWCRNIGHNIFEYARYVCHISRMRSLARQRTLWPTNLCSPPHPPL
jgi:hypothetical protein